MADNLNTKTSSTQTQTFTKGLVKDRSDTYFPENSWSHAVNAVNYTFTGNVGTLSNEQSNYLCGQAPYDIIGKIRLFSGNWIIFSTNNTNSEIGWYNENNCKYCKIVNDPCLNFDQENLIVGESKKNFDCSYQIYWADGRNPDRAMNIGNPETWLCDTTEPWPGVPYLQKCVDPEDTQTGIGCVECTNLQPLQLDCDKIRLSRLIDPVCVEIKNGQYGGNMPNGSYFVVVAYTINQQRVTDYSTPSNVQPIFQHDKLAGSLDITIKNIDKNTFEEFELVVVSIVNQQTVAKQIGYYSTNVTTITLDSIDITNPTVPIELIAVRSPIYEKSEQISQVNGYLLRLSPTTRFDFNYQPLANRIEAKWVAMEYPVDYYRKSGYRTSYLRDEVYSFWIRWVYETGEKTPSYHIPGRPPLENIDIHCPDSPDLISDFDLPPAGDDNIFSDDAYYEVYNTGFITEDYTAAPIPIGDSGQIVAKGRMGYWQSTETYPNKPEVWNSSAHTWSDYKCKLDLLYDTYSDIDLCGEYIRHHKMPDNKCVPHIKSFASANSNGSNLYSDVEKIVLLGVEFDNINYPVDNDGKAIPGIIGYEILRSTREGNKSIIAKGMLNHMREYNINTSDDPMDLSYDNGLYQNYPYNYLGVDPTLTTVDRLVGEDCSPLPGLDRYSRNKFTFHSPDTQFREPFLAEKELKIYGEIFGDVTGNYDFVPGHPKHKVLTDFALLIAAFAGVGIAALSIMGKRTINRASGRAFNLGNVDYSGIQQTTSIGTWVTPFGNISQGPLLDGNITYAPNSIAEIPEDNGSSQENMTGGNQNAVDNTLTNSESNTIQNIVSVLANPDAYYTTAADTFKLEAADRKGYIGPGYDVYLDLTPYQLSSGLPGGLSSFANLLYYWTQGTDSVVKLIEAWIPYVQYALMYKSHGKYTQFDPGNFCISGNQRKLINDLFYIENTLQSYVGLDPAAVPQTTDYSINNLYRNKAVLIEVTTNVLDQNTLLSTTPQVGTCLYNPTELRDGTFGIVPDNTLQSLTTLNSNPIFQTIPGINSTWWTKPTREFTTQTRALYAAIKYRNRNQYGQLEPLRELPISDCVIKLPNVPASNTDLCKTPFVYESGLIYGGDIYIGRYTEKNKFFYFYDWLYEQLDGVGLDYTLKRMIQYPKYWGDFTGFDLGQFITNIGITFNFTPGASPVRILPNDFHNFDRNCSLGPFLPFIGGARSSIFNVNNAYFYLFNTGVRDFFVESEINVDLRDWGEAPEERHYDPYRYTDLDVLFDTSIIKEDNFYKYDYSLSIAKIYTNYVTWGETHPRYYDPNVSELCYQYYPNRLLYSLPFEFEQIRDNWYAFLANNYKDFPSKPNSVNSINKNGAIITFEAASPITFQGVDTLETELNTKITIGDGGLFSQPLQSIVNSDISYEYGSCQDKFSVLSTPYGVFWISQNQGKVFNYSSGLNEISGLNMRWWFDKYLDYSILEDFPNFSITDNPVAGVGCQTVYDNDDQIVYFCKRDFKLRTDLPEGTTVTYPGLGNSFLVNGSLRVDLGDPAYFTDASWTVSYDPKMQVWISFHDWHPNLLIPSKNNFISIKGNGIWQHNKRTDSYCNFYEKDYKFEVEYIETTGETVNTLRSLEYILENSIYDADGVDKYTLLDFNFDHCIIYNNEQVSGLLVLNPTPKNDVIGRLQYPIINPADIQILYDKVENKYRLNMFWDITDDRGEYFNPSIPGFAQRVIWDTAPDGYNRVLNPANLNYNKLALQRKKFRHYLNRIVLYREVSGNVNMIFKISNTKSLYSPR